MAPLTVAVTTVSEGNEAVISTPPPATATNVPTDFRATAAAFLAGGGGGGTTQARFRASLCERDPHNDR